MEGGEKPHLPAENEAGGVGRRPPRRASSPVGSTCRRHGIRRSRLPPTVRLNQFLASCGLGSRRSCERLILEGRILVNGEVCRSLATRIGPHDRIEHEGRQLAARKQLVVLLNKPPGYASTARDERGRKTVYDLLPPEWRHLKHVGRLDLESEGLLLLTNDGDLAQAVTHPRHGLEKEYEVVLDKPFKRERKGLLLKGLAFPEGLAKFESVDFLTRKHVRVVLKQGLNRQVRRMFEAMDCPVKRLHRVRIGSLKMGDLPPGKWRVLSENQVAAFRKTL